MDMRLRRRAARDMAAFEAPLLAVHPAEGTALRCDSRTLTLCGSDGEVRLTGEANLTWSDHDRAVWLQFDDDKPNDVGLTLVRQGDRQGDVRIRFEGNDVA
jgi:hypothetical protein